MNSLSQYREGLRSRYAGRSDGEVGTLMRSRPQMIGNPRILRRQPIASMYDGLLLNGAPAASSIYGVLAEIFDDQCRQEPTPITSAEISLAGHANAFACCGFPDNTAYFRERLAFAPADPKSQLAQWHFAKCFAAVVLRNPDIYRPAAGIGPLEELPFFPGALSERNPQRLLAHLAGAVETRATLDDVWPAFEECVFDFPSYEAIGAFGGACLLWIARIVHHDIAGQPLGETADWLSSHFHTWAEGDDVGAPPIPRSRELRERTRR